MKKSYISPDMVAIQVNATEILADSDVTILEGGIGEDALGKKIVNFEDDYYENGEEDDENKNGWSI